MTPSLTSSRRAFTMDAEAGATPVKGQAQAAYGPLDRLSTTGFAHHGRPNWWGLNVKGVTA